MPWSCPACQIQIKHNEFEQAPRAGSVYRCHVCRLELVLDVATGKLTVAPLDNTPDEKVRPIR
jgi:rubredoxin